MNTKFKRVVTALAAGVIAVGTISVLSACGGGKTEQPHQHTYVEHAAVTATCETAGHDAYFTCSGCQKYFDTDKTEINGVVEIPALGHDLKYVEITRATLTQVGYTSHNECTRCQQWYYDWDNVGTEEDRIYYQEWIQINDGVPGIWNVTEASVLINQVGSGTVGSTITMTQVEYDAGAGTELDRQNFWNSIFLSYNESIIFEQDGSCSGRRSGASWTYDNDSVITVTLANGDLEEYHVRDDGSLLRTWRTFGGDVITLTLYKTSNPL